MKARLATLTLVGTALLLAGTSPTAAQPLMTIEQTLSDQAQATTIAFDGLAFLTGSLGADSFLPPGKVADFSGFQYLRDNDPTQLGHNTDFVTIIARNVLNLLTVEQVAQFVDRAKTQITLVNLYGYMRFPLLEAFRRPLNDALPAGATGLDLAAVKAYSADLYAVDGLISLDRAMLFGDILRNLTTTQRSALDHLATLGGVGNWPHNLPDPLQDLHLDPDISVGVMTYASELYSWYAGSVAADTYFCPERQGTYFGSFYLKDAPAMGNPGYSIGTNVTADSGNAFLAVLTPAQRLLVTNLVTLQKPSLYELVDVRSNVAVQLRQLMVTNASDTNAIMQLCRHYGELDGTISYYYATHFAEVANSLTTNQQAALMALRLQLLGQTLLYPTGAYLYSSPIAMPAITSTDFLFGTASTDRLVLEDTGQTQSFTSTFGQDSDYTLNPPSFTDRGDGTVTDNVTGLIWQKADSGELTWEDAVVYASTNRVGGQSDWRLPTSHELFALLNHGASNPALDTSVFTSSAAQYWWTSEVQATNATNVWAANAGGGLGPHPKIETLSAGGAKRFHARCVRGPFLSGRAQHQFTNNQDGTITDNDTGLTWQQAEVPDALSWENSLKYAESLTLGGLSDWRLPNIKELQSLSDAARTGPSVNTNYFPAARSTRYWSSTTEINGTSRAWNVDFVSGLISYEDKAISLAVRCVRGGATNLTRLASGLHFTEGPAADAAGNVFFSDVPSDTIYKWSVSNQLSVFRSNSSGANGLCFDGSGNLLACEGDTGRLVSITPSDNVTVLAGTYGGLRFNEPNDLWADAAGGVYFTDPVYFGHSVVQGGEHVYFLKPDRSAVLRVVTDLVRPNGLVGTPDGKTLYVADWGAASVFRYAINADGTLASKTLFASVQCDGMTLDAEGNLYFCEKAVLVYDSSGRLIRQISVPERPTNVEFGGTDRKTLFITTDGGSLYSIRMSVAGVANTGVANQALLITDPSLTPATPAAGETVWVTARVTDNPAVSQVTLTYSAGADGTGVTNTVILETMGVNSAKPWTGAGCNHTWTVTYTGGNPFEQRTGSNYGPGNPNGFEFKGGTDSLADSMVAPAQAVDTRGASGFIEFWLGADGLAGNMGWTLQVGPAGSYSTRMSELTGANHGWQLYHYDLLPADLVSNLFLRFQFRGGVGDPRIDLDSVSVQIVLDDRATTSVRMWDDGAHQDGAACDGVYGASIPTQAAGTEVHYSVTGIATNGTATSSPANAPIATWSYVVNARPPTAAMLGWFRAWRLGAGVISLEWQTLLEVQTLSYRVDRSRPGTEWVPATSSLIPAQGTDERPHFYRAADTAAPPLDDLEYRLIALDLQGVEHVLAETHLSPSVGLRARLKADALEIEFSGAPYSSVVLETATDLAGTWVRLNSMTLDSEGQGIRSLPTVDGTPARFFRPREP